MAIDNQLLIGTALFAGIGYIIVAWMHLISNRVAVHLPPPDHEALPVVRKVSVEKIGPALCLLRRVALVEGVGLLNRGLVDRPETDKLTFRESLSGRFGQSGGFWQAGGFRFRSG